jgi:hypothetical protein
MMQTTIEVPDRVKAHTLLRALNAELLSHDSATLTLERWCEARGLASPARIVAERRHGSHVEPSVEQRRLLGVSTTDPIRYRRVRLRCGDCVVSEADNWYVPARLTAAMNREELARPVIPPQVLVHTAVLTLPDGTPFSFLVETYTREVLALRSRLWPSEAAAANDSIVRVRRRRWHLSQGYTEPIA